jgi:hypothetical protein
MNEKTLTVEQLADLEQIKSRIVYLGLSLAESIRERDSDMILAGLNAIGKRLAEARGILEQ